MIARAGRLALLAWLVAAGAVAEAARLPVRFAEGSTHGFLVLLDEGGAVLARGELLQTAEGTRVRKTMTFRFADGSLYDERVSFDADEVFALRRYELTQRGPAFDVDAEIALSADGRYRVKTRKHDERKVDVHEGRIDLPPDVYNGMIFVVLKSMRPGIAETIHYVAFTPKPRVIEMRMAPAGPQSVALGDSRRAATHYVLEPRLGTWLKLAAAATGRTPPDLHAWFLTEDVPAFVAFRGPMEMGGPSWRIELESPRLPVSAARGPG